MSVNVGKLRKTSVCLLPTTITYREIQTAVSLLIPGQLLQLESWPNTPDATNIGGLCVMVKSDGNLAIARKSELGVPIHLLVLTYKLRIRVFLEQNVPLWTFNVSQIMSRKIEKVQKTAVFIILGKHAHKDYYCNLTMLELDTLQNRREKLSVKFAKNIMKHPQHRQIFTTTASQTRNGKKIVVPASRTARYEKSTIPSLAS